MVQSTPYQVERLDWEGRKAFVARTHVDYYTDSIDFTKLKVLDRFEGCEAGRGDAHHGEVHVVRRVAGYKKIRYYTRSEEHTSELQSLMRISYAVFCLKKK